MIKLTVEQKGRLLFKAAHEPRRNQKRYLKDLGGTGSAEELDEVLESIQGDAVAAAEFERLEKQQQEIRESVDSEVNAGVSEMLADLRVAMEEGNVMQSELAKRCGFSQPQVAAYLAGKKEPGIGNLVKLAQGVGRTWKLEKPGWPMVVREPAAH